ncbi:DNA methyltransferase [Sulfurimonas sp. HSL-1656]|uniref:DNA methyltransferase n=1 Tax=Thiomicrolovo subterrani TaxID=3131934 RepID=UPI0031F894A9
MQLEVVRIVLKKIGGGRGLIVAPLGVRQEFFNDAKVLATGEHPFITDRQREELKAWLQIDGNTAPKIKFIRSVDEANGDGIYITNYETVRDGKLDPRDFDAASLDEASVLRGFGGTKTFREFMAIFAGDRKTMSARVRGKEVQYRFVATATPSPNDYIELLAYAAFLGIMDVSQAKTRFFKRNSEKADELTLLPHKEKEFWMWVSSWGLFIEKPSDLGLSDEGYELPAMTVNWSEVPNDYSEFEAEKDGQGLLFKNAAAGLSQAAREKRDSIGRRIDRMMEIFDSYEEEDQVIVWCTLNDEQKAVEEALRAAGITFSSLAGNQTIEKRDELLQQWLSGETRVFLTKPMMYGSGANLQQCNKEIFLGIDYKFNDWIQGVHRVYRFLQARSVRIDSIYTEAESEIRKVLEEKWEKHRTTGLNMTKIIKEFGLSSAAMANALKRSMGVERIEVSGNHYTAVNNDCVQETKGMDENSLDLIVTSVPFSTQYEYSPNYADFGHTDTNEHFFEQMDYLTPELLRTLKPGRIAAIHVKDRIVPGGLTGLGFQTVYPFHVKCIEHYTSHGFAYMGMITVVTDVVRENNQTYRLGWSEVCKDGTKISAGLPEYILLFRKPQTNSERSYADEPVTHSKEDYTRARWQTDAHGYWRSSGDRHLLPEELEAMEPAQVFRAFRDYHLEEIYDYDHHVKIGEHLDAKGKLPVTFMLLQPPSWMDDVWTDVARMRTLNMVQSVKGKEQHLCPLQFDIVDRLIERFSNEGETVYDPFGGIMTVPYRAIKKGRKGYACELNPAYFTDGVHYLQAAEKEANMPTLFDFMEEKCGA